MDNVRFPPEGAASPAMAGGVAPSSYGAMNKLVYVQCPKCRRRISEPLPRGVIVPYTHRVRGIHGAACRLIIQTATEGENHRVWALPHDESYERALLKLLG